MRRSGERSPTSPKPAVIGPVDVDAALTKRTKDTPCRGGRRRSSEETVGAEDSRRSSQADEDSGNGPGGSGAVGNGPRQGNGAPCDGGNDSDWEVLEHAGELSGLELQGDDEHAAERPLSPGVDFSTAYMIGKEGGEGLQPEGAGAPDGKGQEDSCKWEDAANMHSFLVRGPTYLKVRSRAARRIWRPRRSGEHVHDADSAAAVVQSLQKARGNKHDWDEML